MNLINNDLQIYSTDLATQMMNNRWLDRDGNKFIFRFNVILTISEPSS